MISSLTRRADRGRVLGHRPDEGIVGPPLRRQRAHSHAGRPTAGSPATGLVT